MEALEQRIAPAAISIPLTSLNGANGFELHGEVPGYSTGTSVSDAGDVNGDGFADFMIGSESRTSVSSAIRTVYVVFGREDGFPRDFDISTIDGFNGFQIVEGKLHVGFGGAFRGAGDFNGDGFGDIIVGSPNAHSQGLYSGAAFVVFGKADWSTTPRLDVVEVDGSNGIRISGSMGGNDSLGDHLGSAVNSAGDFNGDGVDDVAVRGARGGSQGAALADSYIIFGATNSLPADLNISDLNGVNGFRISGVPLSGLSTGGPIAEAGDLNGDGFDDVVIGQSSVYENGGAYVLFGRPSPFLPEVDVSTLDGTNGFVLTGDNIGASVSRAGDVNGDGIDDLLLGAPSDRVRGAAYVVFGKQTPFTGRLDVSKMTETDAFRIVGGRKPSQFGDAVSGAGDFNGDGIDDLIVSAPSIEVDENGNTGRAYVIFGRRGGFGAEIRTTSLSATEGFQLVGEAGSNAMPLSVSAAGDINNDGLSDVLVGGPGVSPRGSTYLFFGTPGVQISPNALVLQEADGDIVRIELSGAHLSLQNVKFGEDGNIAIDLTHGSPSQQKAVEEKELNLTIAVTTPKGNPGDGFTNVGFIDATGLELGKVRVEGHLGQILAGDGKAAVRSLKVNGDLGSDGGALRPTQLLGAVGKLYVGGTVHGTIVQIGGKADAIVIKGDLIGNARPQAIASATVPENDFDRSAVLHNPIPSGVLLTEGIDSLRIGGSVKGGGIFSTKDLGLVSVLGDFSDSRIFSGGKINAVELGKVTSENPGSPATVIARDKLNSLVVNGSLENARILVGYDENEVPINADANIRKVVIKGDWVASSLGAGVADSTNDGYGRNDVVIAGDMTPSTLSKIARITIKGVASGSEIALDHFGITAQQIGRLKINGTDFGLSKDLADDILLDQSNSDFRLIEVHEDQLSVAER